MDVPPGLEPLAQSVFSEALRNAHKHAEPTSVVVSADYSDGAFILKIINDGVTGAKGPHTAGMGLRLAAFEALHFGGFVEFGAREDNRWQVRLVVPVDDE
jgi:nitrate/nitrite-specific signal transduction histidine kinase